MVWLNNTLTPATLTVDPQPIESFRFPRAGNLEDIDWEITGINTDYLKNPIEMMSKHTQRLWANSRGDLATFLKLKSPEWQPQDKLVLITGVQSCNGHHSESELAELHAKIIDQLAKTASKAADRN